MRGLICLLLTVGALAAAADPVYRWVDRHGVVHYSDKPPDRNAEPAKLPPLQTYHGGVQGDPFAALATPATTPSAPRPAAPVIVQPKDQATIRDALGRIEVSVDVSLADGEGLIYTVDGQPQNKAPTRQTRFQLAGIVRGTHTVGVELTDSAGKPIARAQPVTVYMKPPTVHHPAR